MNENSLSFYGRIVSRLAVDNNFPVGPTVLMLSRPSLVSILNASVSRQAILMSGSRKPNATRAVKIFQLSRISAMAKTGWQFSPWRRYSLC